MSARGCFLRRRIGDEVRFVSEPDLGRRMLQRAIDAEVPAG